MPLFDHDPETARKYLLGQLSDDQQSNFEQRLLSEDELSQEFDITTEELVEDYLDSRLTQQESEWFEQNFLASPEGKRSHKFATTFQRYISKNQNRTQKRTWAERLAAFWTARAVPLRAIASLAVVVVLVGIFWYSRTPSPRSFATVTLTNSPITRSGGGEVARIKFKEDALRVNMVLPETASSGASYRAELIDASGQNRTLEPIGQDARSVSVEIPASRLAPGQYAITLSTITSDNTPQRIPGSYQFTIE